MTKLLTKIVSFLTLTGILNFALWNLTWGKYNSGYETINTEASIYFIGDSHTDAIGKFADSKMANLSFPNDSYDEVLTKIKHLRKVGSPKLIFLGADDHMINSCRSNQTNGERLVYFKSSEDYSSAYEYIKDRYLRYYIPFFNPRHRQLFNWYVKHGDYDFFNARKYFTDKSLTDLKEDSINFWINKRVDAYYEKVDTDQISKLLEIIKFCRKHDIEIVGVKTPLYKDYLTQTGHWESPIDSIFEAQKIKLLDFKTFINNQRSYFHDPGHLNNLGSKYLRDSLIRFIKQSEFLDPHQP